MRRGLCRNQAAARAGAVAEQLLREGNTACKFDPFHPITGVPRDITLKEITYTENIQATDADIKLQLSHDLKDWNSDSQMEIISETISDDNKTKTIRVRTSDPISSSKDTYFRFNISL